MTRVSIPRVPRSAARARPIGPAPTIRTGMCSALVAMTPYNCKRRTLCGGAGTFLEQVEAAQDFAIAYREDAGRALGAMADHRAGRQRKHILRLPGEAVVAGLRRARAFDDGADHALRA